MRTRFAVSVVVIAVVYIIIGGLVFRAIEQHNDDEQRHEIQSTLQAFFNGSDDSLIRLEEVKRILLPTVQKAYQYGVEISWNDTASNPNWDLYSSIFFSVTVVTTIGYGNSPLKTPGGRMFCIFYALAGVPLCLFTLFVVGQQEKRFIYFVAKKLAFGFRENEHKLHIFSTLMVSLGGSVVFIYLSAVVFKEFEGWNYQEATYFCFITLLTVGFGDYVAGWSSASNKVWYRALIAVWILFGLSWCTIVISVCQDLYNDLFEKTGKVAGAVGNLIESSVKSKMENITKTKAADSPKTSKEQVTSSPESTPVHETADDNKTVIEELND